MQTPPSPPNSPPGQAPAQIRNPLHGLTLEAIRQIQPDATRILFSGHADRDVLVKAINDSEIYGYIGKPWREHELKNTVSQAVAYRNLLRENRHLAELMAG